MAEGFVYVSDSGSGPMAGARAGERIRTAGLGPPWIVVDHAIETVIASQWPGRLLRVSSVPPADEAERGALARAGQDLRTGAGYTRVLAVDVLAELLSWLLFGEHGEAVAEIVEQARRLGISGAGNLAAGRHPEAARAFSRAWQRWLEQQPNGADYRGGDHSRTLAVAGAGPVRSPIGYGLTLTWTCVAESARRCAGASAFTVDSEGKEVLLDPWAAAGSALLDAAMALGAPGLHSPSDAAVLTTAWRALPRPDASISPGTSPGSRHVCDVLTVPCCAAAARGQIRDTARASEVGLHCGLDCS